MRSLADRIVTLGVKEAHEATKGDAKGFVASVKQLTRLTKSLNAVALSGGFSASSSCSSAFG